MNTTSNSNSLFHYTRTYDNLCGIGRTVVDHINDLILSEAKMLLKSTGLSIVQIAERLDFADAPSFGKFFSRMAGVPPGQYRRLP